MIVLALTHGITTTAARLPPDAARHYASLLLICADYLERGARSDGHDGRKEGA